MSAIVAIARLRNPIATKSQILALHRKLVGYLEPISGLIACTAWRAQSDVEEYLVVTEYANDEEAERGIEAIQASDFFIDVAEAFEEPMDLNRSSVAFQHGCLVADVPVGQYLSYSKRTSDPGKFEELVGELKRIFGELAAIEGYLGSVVAQNQMLDEEIEGIVLWSTVESFMSSLPIKLLYEVHLFHRIQ